MAERFVLLSCPVLLLAACGQGDAGRAGQEAGRELISCATGDADGLTASCTIERSFEEGMLVLVIRHADGGFRRLRVMQDGSGLIAADGADQARSIVSDKGIEVELAVDRYLLPSSITDDDDA